MLRRASAFALIGAVVVCSAAPAATLKSFVSKEGKVVVTLTGEIAPGDADSLKALIKSANETGRQLSGVRLNSRGGTWENDERSRAALELGAVIREAKLATVVPNGAECTSACAIVFAAGTQKFASHNASIGIQGVHTGSVLWDEAGTELLKALTMLGVPPAIITRMAMTGPKEMIYLTPDDLVAMGTTMTGKPTNPQSAITESAPKPTARVVICPAGPAPATTKLDDDPFARYRYPCDGEPSVVEKTISPVPARADDPHSETKTVTANDLNAMCKDTRGSVGEAFCVGFLWGIKAGVAQAPAMLKAGYGCIPGEVTGGQLQTIVKSYMDSHPEHLQDDARSIVIAALSIAFPCSARAGDSPTPSPSASKPGPNAADACARRCLPPPGRPSEFPGSVRAGLAPQEEACLRVCGEEMGRTPR